MTYAEEEFSHLSDVGFIKKCHASFSVGKPLKVSGETCLEYLLNLANDPERPKKAMANKSIYKFAAIDGALDGIEGKFIGFHLNNIFPYSIFKRHQLPHRGDSASESESEIVSEIMEDFYTRNGSKLPQLACPSDRYDYKSRGGVISCLEEIIDRDRVFPISDYIDQSVFRNSKCHVSNREHTQRNMETATCMEKLIHQGKFAEREEFRKKVKYKNSLRMIASKRFTTETWLDSVKDGRNRGRTYFELAITTDPIFDTDPELPPTRDGEIYLTGLVPSIREWISKITIDDKDEIELLKKSKCKYGKDTVRCIDSIIRSMGFPANIRTIHMLGERYIDNVYQFTKDPAKRAEELTNFVEGIPGIRSHIASRKKTGDDVLLRAIDETTEDILSEVENKKLPRLAGIGIAFGIAASKDSVSGSVKDKAIRVISEREKDAQDYVAAAEGASGSGIKYASLFKSIFKKEFDSNFEYSEETRRVFDQACFSRGKKRLVKAIVRNVGKYGPYDYKKDEFGITGTYKVNIDETYSEDEVEKYVDAVESFWNGARDILKEPIITTLPDKDGKRIEVEAQIYIGGYSNKYEDVDVTVQYFQKRDDPKKYTPIIKSETYRFMEVLSKFPKSIKRELDRRDKTLLTEVQKIMDKRKRAPRSKDSFVMVISNKTADIARSSICQSWENNSCISLLGGMHEWATKSYADYGSYIAYLVRKNPNEHRWLARLFIHRCGECLSVQDRLTHYSVKPHFWHILNDAVKTVMYENHINENCAHESSRTQLYKHKEKVSVACKKFDFDEKGARPDEDDDYSDDYARGASYDPYSDGSDIQIVTENDLEKILKRRISGKDAAHFISKM